MDIPPPFDALWFRIFIGLIIGLVLGSFTTMLSYRLPRKLSIVYPPSHCPKCNTPLKPRDLIPLLSWVFEGGKCRHCKSSISLSYLLIEMATTFASIIAFGFIGFTPAIIPALLAIVIFISLVAINLLPRR